MCKIINFDEIELLGKKLDLIFRPINVKHHKESNAIEKNPNWFTSVRLYCSPSFSAIQFIQRTLHTMDDNVYDINAINVCILLVNNINMILFCVFFCKCTKTYNWIHIHIHVNCFVMKAFSHMCTLDSHINRLYRVRHAQCDKFSKIHLTRFYMNLIFFTIFPFRWSVVLKSTLLVFPNFCLKRKFVSFSSIFERLKRCMYRIF